MPIKAYVGMPRSGKSYEVVAFVVIPALKQGRRVITNLAGVNFDAICQILFADGVPIEHIGQLVTVTEKDVNNPKFWLTDEDAQDGSDTFIQPGDQLVLDEVWRFWKKRGDIHPRAMNFFRMHGHFPHPKTGFICEIALITQNVRDINENIKGVVLETYRTTKNTKLGSDKSYIVDIFQQGSTAKTDFIRTLSPRLYNKKYFPCYKSHSQKQEGAVDAVESSVDDRGNILKGPLFRVVMPLMLVLFLAGGYGVYRFFSNTKSKFEDQKQTEISQPVVDGLPVVSSQPQSRPNLDTDWRVTGYYQRDNSTTIALQDSSGNVRTLSDPPKFKLSALGIEVELPEGGFSTSWTALNQNSRGVLP